MRIIAIIICKFIYVISINRVIITSLLFNIYIFINKLDIVIFIYYNYNKKNIKNVIFFFYIKLK